MQNITEKEMVKIVTELSLNYPYPPKTHAQIEALAKLWLYDVGFTTFKDLKEASHRHRKESSRFPTIHDMINQRDIIHRTRAMITPALEEKIEVLTDEQVAENIQKVRDACKGVGG